MINPSIHVYQMNSIVGGVIEWDNWTKDVPHTHTKKNKLMDQISKVETNQQNTNDLISNVINQRKFIFQVVLIWISTWNRLINLN